MLWLISYAPIGSLSKLWLVSEAPAAKQVEVPLSSSKVPAILATLNERKAYYLEKQRDAKAKGEVDVEEEEPASAAPAANGHKSEPEMNGFSGTFCCQMSIIWGEACSL